MVCINRILSKNPSRCDQHYLTTNQAKLNIRITWRSMWICDIVTNIFLFLWLIYIIWYFCIWKFCRFKKRCLYLCRILYLLITFLSTHYGELITFDLTLLTWATRKLQVQTTSEFFVFLSTFFFLFWRRNHVSILYNK